MYKVEYLESVSRDDISKLPKTEKKRIRQAIEERLVQDPIRFGKPLRYILKGGCSMSYMLHPSASCRRMKVGYYRIIFKLETKTILIVKIGHRKEIYKKPEFTLSDVGPIIKKALSYFKYRDFLFFI